MAQQGESSAAGRGPAAATISAALNDIAARVKSWKQEREAVSAELKQLLAQARQMLADLGDDVSARGRVRKGGRPKGYKMSAATKAKLRAAWARRKGATAAPAAPRKRTMSAEARARIAAAQKARWAKFRKAKAKK